MSLTNNNYTIKYLLADIILRLSDQMKMYSGETENEYDTTFIQSRYLQLQVIPLPKIKKNSK